MEIMVDNILQGLESLFKKNNYEILTFHDILNKKTKFCVDFLIKKNNLIYLVKVFPNIDNLNESVIENLKNLCMLLDCHPLLIGIKNRYNKLEDNTIYLREDLPFISSRTISMILNSNIYPTCLSRKGGKIIFLDGNLVKSIREQKSISRKEISEQLGVTKRTLCSYENETMRPSQKIAEKILQILDDKTIFRKINVFEWQIKVNFIQEEKSQKRDLTDVESHLQDIFEDIGVSTIWYKKGQLPFEFSISSNNYVLNTGDEFYPVLSGLSQDTTKVAKLNLHHLRSFAKFFHKNAFFIVNDDFKLSNHKIRLTSDNIKVPVIKLKDLEKMDTEKDFVELFEES